ARPAPASAGVRAPSDGRFGFQVAGPLPSRPRGAFAYHEVREARKAEERAERLRLYYVAMTRAIDRLIVSGAVDTRKRTDDTPIGWVLSRLDAEEELEAAGAEPVELEREGARILIRIDRYRPEPEEVPRVLEEPAQLSLFEALTGDASRAAPVLPPLEALPAPPLHDVRRLSYSALALFERCSFRYFAERVVGMRERPGVGTVPGQEGLAATEIGDAAHKLLEQVDLAAPAPPDVEQVRAWYPAITEDELSRVNALVDGFCGSELAARVAALPGAAKERHFTFEHDGVLVHGYLDVFHLAGGRALVADYKTNVLGDAAPADVVETEYRLQRLVYALACFRAGAEDVEVVYQFLERPHELVSTSFARTALPALEEELSAAIARIRRGEFVPTPSDFACSGCPALDLVCAGPRLRNAGGVRLVAVG